MNKLYKIADKEERYSIIKVSSNIVLFQLISLNNLDPTQQTFYLSNQ